MSQLGQRIFAASGAILFFVTSIALSIVVVITLVQDGKKKSPATASPATSACQSSRTEDALAVPEVYTTADPVTGLGVTDIQPGTDPAAKVGDCLVVKYYGTLAVNGNLFDENFTQPTAFAFTLGSGQVIKGWDQGLVGLKVGGTRRLVIPENLGYADQAQGDKIPAHSNLVFVVKLLRIQKT